MVKTFLLVPEIRKAKGSKKVKKIGNRKKCIFANQIK